LYIDFNKENIYGNEIATKSKKQSSFFNMYMSEFQQEEIYKIEILKKKSSNANK